MAASIEARRDELIWSAWHTAYLTRVERMPTLDSLLTKSPVTAPPLPPATSAEEVQRRVRAFLAGRPKA